MGVYTSSPEVHYLQVTDIFEQVKKESGKAYWRHDMVNTSSYTKIFHMSS